MSMAEMVAEDDAKDEVLPTYDDVVKVFNCLPDSSPVFKKDLLVHGESGRFVMPPFAERFLLRATKRLNGVFKLEQESDGTLSGIKLRNITEEETFIVAMPKRSWNRLTSKS